LIRTSILWPGAGVEHWKEGLGESFAIPYFYPWFGLNSEDEAFGEGQFELVFDGSAENTFCSEG
jgi:hypothetical protein